MIKNERNFFIFLTVCGAKPADVVFVLDSSSSEGRANFQKQINFVKDFVQLKTFRK